MWMPTIGHLTKQIDKIILLTHHFLITPFLLPFPAYLKLIRFNLPPTMASLTMTASFLTAAQPSSIKRRNLVSAKATVCSEKTAGLTGDNQELKVKNESNSRRGMILAAASAIWAMRSVPEMVAAALADGEPKPGTPEARKKYYPVCVTMPTARICHK